MPKVIISERYKKLWKTEVVGIGQAKFEKRNGDIGKVMLDAYERT